MRRGRPPRIERGILVVPVRPGAVYESLAAAPPSARARRRLLIIAAAGAGVALIAYGTVRLAHAPSRTPVAAAPVASVPAHRTAPRTQPTPAQRAQATAARIAARLPVSVDSAAVLRRGAIAYVVGGKTRRHGTPTDRIWRIDLAGGRIRVVGHFLEPLADAGFASRAGVLYLAGGWTGEKVGTAVLRWAPGGDATVVARLPAGLRRATAGFVGTRLYVAGGFPKQVFVVDVGTGTVRRVAALPRKLRGKDSNLDYPVQSRASYR